MTRATFFANFLKIERSSIQYKSIVRIERGRFSLIIQYHRPKDSYNAKPCRAKLPWVEMRPEDRKKCLEILRAKLPAEVVSNL